jgi:hypothetical protein
MDLILLYPLIWLVMVGAGLIGYFVSGNRADVYFTAQLLIIALVLFVFRDTFGAMDSMIWTIYALGFGSYIVAFLAGASIPGTPASKLGWVLVFQGIAFAVTYLVLPAAFGIVEVTL